MGNLKPLLDQVAGERLVGEHTLQKFFQCHRVAARFPTVEEVTVAGQFAIVERHAVVIVLTAELDRECGEMNAVTLLGVAAGLFDFPNHAGIHVVLPLPLRGR